MLGVSDAVSLGSGRDSGVVVRAGGQVQVWGHNAYGQLGDGTTTNRTLGGDRSRCLRGREGGWGRICLPGRSGRHHHHTRERSTLPPTSGVLRRLGLHLRRLRVDRFRRRHRRLRPGISAMAADQPRSSPGHTYAEAGSYEIALTVTDDDGAVDTDHPPARGLWRGPDGSGQLPRQLRQRPEHPAGQHRRAGTCPGRRPPLARGDDESRRDRRNSRRRGLSWAPSRMGWRCGPGSSLESATAADAGTTVNVPARRLLEDEYRPARLRRRRRAAGRVELRAGQLRLRALRQRWPAATKPAVPSFASGWTRPAPLTPGPHRRLTCSERRLLDPVAAC